MSYSENAYVYLRKKILDWQWFTDVNTAHFFIYCLLKANWESGNWKGIEYERGQFIASLETISRESGLSVQCARTAIKHLISTQELTQSKVGKYRMFTVVKYDYYQQGNTISNKELTRNQQETNKELTTDNKVIKEISNKVKKNNKPPISPFDELEKIDLSENMKTSLREWFEYKKQRKEKSYQTEMGFKKFITQVRQAIEKCGEEKVIEQFDYAMSRGWSGAYLEKIEPEKNTQFTFDDIMQELNEDGD